MLTMAIICQFVQVESPADGQTTSAALALPSPTGPFAVGRVTLHWTDRLRIESLTPAAGPRELMVDIWYPAEPAVAPVAAYIDRSAFDQPRSAERLKGYLRAAYDPIKAGLVRTHATQGTPFAHSVKRSPVLVFSHGGGEAREVYTTQLEDLASHGYTVAAITHTHESVLAIFPDGRHIVLTPKRWPPPKVSLIEGLPPSQEANPDRLRWWADDIRFVLNELGRENRIGSRLLPFAGRLDLARVGAFGHSAGGQAAAHACQVDRRLRACLNQDGLSGFAPYYLDERGWGMDQAFMLIERAPDTDPPTDEELAAMKMTRSQAYELLAKLKARHDAALRNTGKTSYWVVLENKTTTHADFTDVPLLQVRDGREAETRGRILAVIRNFTRAFFDQNLKGMKSTPLDRNATSEFVQAVQKFEPAERPRRAVK